MFEYKYMYTTREGGNWIKLKCDIPHDIMEAMLRHSGSWRDGDKSMIIVGGKDYLIHSMKFPNGRIWDSHFRRFRDEL